MLPTKYFFTSFAAALILIVTSLPALSQTQDVKKSTEKGISLLEVVRNTIKNKADIQIQQEQVDFGKGALQEARGQFDWNFSAGANRSENTTPLTEAQQIAQGLTDASTRVSTDTYRAGFDKQLRSGITISPGFQVDRNDNHNSYTNPTSLSSVNFRINLPLLKGKGAEATGAQEMAAKIDLESACLDYKSVVSKSVVNTIEQYWNLSAIREKLAIYKDGEARARNMLEIYQKMVAADEKPAADLDQLRANLADRISETAYGERQLISATQSLWFAMGVPYNKAIALFPLTHLPDATIADLESQTLYSPEYYMEMARNNYPDILSLKKKVESARILLRAAEINKKAKLDLVLGTGYAGLWENGDALQSVRSLNTNIRGLNASAGIEYRFPVENSSALGVLRQRQAAYNQAILRVADWDKSIISLMEAFVPQLRLYFLGWKESLVAVQSYQNAVRNEDKKVRMGMSTVINLIQTQDKLRNALLNVLDNRKNYAVAVANVRHMTGTLISEDGDLEKINMEQLITMPKKTVSSQKEGG